jgi:hypothetical protein
MGTRYSPLVETSTDCPEMCLFKDQDPDGYNNSFCWKYKSPLIKVGWDIDQNGEDTTNVKPGKGWDILLKPYFSGGFYLESNLIIKRIWTQKIKIEIPTFKVNTFYRIAFATSGQACIGFGWHMDAVNIKLKTTSYGKDCYKILLGTVCDLKSTW